MPTSEDRSIEKIPAKKEKVIRKHRREHEKREQTQRDAQQSVAAVKNLSPGVFTSGNLQMVPSCLSHFTDWLCNRKPVKMKDLSLGTAGYSSSPVAMKSEAFRVANKTTRTLIEIRRRLDDWDRRMVNYEEVEEQKSKPTPAIKVPSAFTIRDDPWPPEPSIPREFTVVISETSTFTLFAQKKRSALVGTPTAEGYDADNQRYSERLKTYKKVNTMDTQTPLDQVSSRSAGIGRHTKRNKETLACNSDIFDCNQLQSLASQVELHAAKAEDKEDDDPKSSKKGYMELQTETTDHLKDDADFDEEGDFGEFSEAKKIIKVLESVEFCKCALVMGRTLERNICSGKQKFFRTSSRLDPLARSVEFKYTLKHLWTLKSLRAWGMPVTSMSVNPMNTNIIATGHGRYFGDQPDHLGRICIWNLKNCTAPEKMLDFKSGVTSVCFSRQYPYALLVGLLRGYIAVVDVASYPPKVMVDKEKEALNRPLWETNWMRNEVDQDYAVSTSDEGVVHWYTRNVFDRSQLLLLGRRERKVKGVEVTGPDVDLPRRPSIFCLEVHPEDRCLYLCGTEDGCVHICSTEYWNGHVDVFQAHIGPVFHIKYHPVTPKIFLTTGLDFCVRIWAVDIFEPLVTLQTSELPVEDASWSPTNPSVLVSISGNLIHVWDIRRLILEPCAELRSPSDDRLTCVSLTSSGTALMAGDAAGHVHVYSLQDLPFEPSVKPEALYLSLRRILTGNEQMMAKLAMLGYPFNIEPDK